jgi:hypothetical protein
LTDIWVNYYTLIYVEVLPCACVVVFVPESIATFQLLELDSDDASERRADQPTLQRGLAQAAGKQIDVVHILVNLIISYLGFIIIYFLRSHELHRKKFLFRAGL